MLEANGYALVPVGKFIKVVPVSEARTENIESLEKESEQAYSGQTWNVTDLPSLKNKLAALQTRYTANHPDVIRIKEIIAVNVPQVPVTSVNNSPFRQTMKSNARQQDLSLCLNGFVTIYRTAISFSLGESSTLKFRWYFLNSSCNANLIQNFSGSPITCATLAAR